MRDEVWDLQNIAVKGPPVVFDGWEEIRLKNMQLVEVAFLGRVHDHLHPILKGGWHINFLVALGLEWFDPLFDLLLCGLQWVSV